MAVTKLLETKSNDVYKHRLNLYYFKANESVSYKFGRDIN